VNLGDFFSRTDGNSGTGGLFKNKTILIVLVVVIVIFGFGYGRGVFPGGGRSAGASQYGGYFAYRGVDPGDGRSRKRSKHRHHGHHGHHGSREEAVYGFGYGASGQVGLGGAYGASYGYPGYSRPLGSFFGNDWWFIIAIIALLFLLGEDSSGNDNTNNINNLNPC